MSEGYPEHDGGPSECLPVQEVTLPEKREKYPDLRDELLAWHSMLENRQERESLEELRSILHRAPIHWVFLHVTTNYCTLPGYCSKGVHMLLTQCGLTPRDFQGVQFYEIFNTLIVSAVLGDREICESLCSIISSIEWPELHQENECRLQHIVHRHMYQGTPEEPFGYASEDGSGSASNQFAYFEYIRRSFGDTIYDPDPVLAVIKKELHIATCPRCVIQSFYGHTRDTGTKSLLPDEVLQIYERVRPPSFQLPLLGRVVQRCAKIVLMRISER